MHFTQFPIKKAYFGSQISVSDVGVLTVLGSARGMSHCRSDQAVSELCVSIKPLRKITRAAVEVCSHVRKLPFRSAIAAPGAIQPVPRLARNCWRAHEQSSWLWPAEGILYPPPHPPIPEGIEWFIVDQEESILCIIEDQTFSLLYDLTPFPPLPSVSLTGDIQ
jgi:hypothetical protein